MTYFRVRPQPDSTCGGGSGHFFQNGRRINYPSVIYSLLLEIET